MKSCRKKVAGLSGWITLFFASSHEAALSHLVGTDLHRAQAMDTADIYKSLEVLVHSGDIHHHELAAVAERVKSLERRMDALQTPEKVSAREAATVLEQPIDFAYSKRQPSEDDRLAVSIRYKRDAEYHYEVSFFDVIIGQWLDAYTLPFVVQGHAIPHTTAFPRSVTWANIARIQGGSSAYAEDCCKRLCNRDNIAHQQHRSGRPCVRSRTNEQIEQY